MARWLSPSVDFRRSASHCLIDRSHLPPVGVASCGDGGADHVAAVARGPDLERQRLEVQLVPAVGGRLQQDGVRDRRRRRNRRARGRDGVLTRRHAVRRGLRSEVLVDPGTGARQPLAVDLREQLRRLAKQPGEVARELRDEVPDEDAQDRDDVDVQDDDRGRARERFSAHAQPPKALDDGRQDVRDQDCENERERDLSKEVDDEDAKEREPPELRELA